jgi:hypothetical protein
MTTSKKRQLPTKQEYFKRLFRSFTVATIFMVFSLGIGICGYHFICGFGWIDSLLNSSMILGGMGPVDAVPNNAGKIFASFYALYSGISFLSAFAILVAPALHRLIHKLKLEVEDDPD